MILESSKAESLLAINSFNKPSQLKGKEAWFSLITNLLFLTKGMYPSMPVMGIGIQNYEYEFIDDVKLELQQEILSQIHTYLPDIPVSDVSLSTSLIKNDMVLLVTIMLYENKGIEAGVIAISSKKRQGLDLSAFAIQF